MPDATLNAKEIFFEALDLASPAAVDDYVASACGEDEQLRRRVEELLRAHRRAGRFLGGAEPTDESDNHLAVTEHVGSQIGPYKIREQIGEGGFGVVFVAEQTEPIKRKVALKIIKPGMDTKAVIARFEVERQALAMMEHPNISEVLDAGTTERGRPYFVMELVRGVPITNYCRQARLDARRRLQLFVTVCQAVQHAHQKGIIHRDIKPSNVMVSLHDGTPVVKVIDFGVAKAINQQLTDHTVYTRFSEMIGTPMYMSPEQAELSGLDIDTRTDVYSLGVLLYELLTGTTPFDSDTVKDAGYDEMRRMIREDDPPKPSTRLSTLRDQTASVRPHTDAQKLTRIVRGELDWIVMKAIEKDRVRRYESASAFAQDVVRYLNGEPVDASPPSRTYRLRKIIRRNRVALTTTVLVAVALLIGSAASIWQAVEANQARREAVENLGESEIQRGRAEANLRVAKDALAEVRQQREVANQARRRAELGELRARTLLYASEMRTAIEAWREHELGVVLERLAGQVPKDGERDLRGFEWHFLDTATRRTPERTFLHDVPVTDCQVTPDGQTLVTAAEDGKIRFWNLKDGSLEATIQAHARAARSIAMSPSGEWLVSGGDDDLVQVWDVGTRELARLPVKMKTGVETVAWSPNGRWIAAASRYSEFRVWSAEGKELLQVDNDHRHESLAFSPDGTRLYVPTRSHISVYDIEKATEDTQLTTGDLQNVRKISLLDNGRYLAAAERFDKRIAIIDCETGELVRYVDGGVKYAQRVVPSPDGWHLASAGPDGMLRLLDVKRDGVRSITLAHAKSATSVCFGPCGYVVTGGHDGLAKLWQLARLQDWSYIGPSEDLFNAAFSQEQTSVWTAIPMFEARPILVDAETGKQQEPPAEGGGFAATAAHAISPDKCWMAIGGRKGEVAVWDLATGVIATRLENLRAEVIQVEYSPSGDRLAGGSDNGQVIVWQMGADWRQEHPALTSRFEFPELSSLRFSADGTHLAAVSSKQSRLSVWEVQTGKRTLDIRTPLAGTGLAFHPDGTRIAATCDDRRIRLWSTAQGVVEMETDAFPSYALVLCFSPDGRTLLSGHEDGSIRLWHIPSSLSLGVVRDASTTGLRIRSLVISQRHRILAAISGGQQSLLISGSSDDLAVGGGSSN